MREVSCQFLPYNATLDFDLIAALNPVDCGDCGEQHYHEWSLLRASLQQLLDEGQMRPHEPAFDPDPASYVTWEYCRGYADAVLSDS